MKCPYSPGVFNVYEDAVALRNDMLGRLSKTARSTVPALDMLRLYTPYVFAWLKATSHRLLRWTANAVKIDTREPMHDGVPYSASIVDVFTACQSAYDFLATVELNTAFVNTQFAEVACSVIRRYVELESNAFCDMVADSDAGGDGVPDKKTKAEKEAERQKRRSFLDELVRDDEGSESDSASSMRDSSTRLREMLGSSQQQQQQRKQQFFGGLARSRSSSAATGPAVFTVSEMMWCVARIASLVRARANAGESGWRSAHATRAQCGAKQH